MGTRILGNTADPPTTKSYYQNFSGGNVLKAANASQTTDEMYVDRIWVYSGGKFTTQQFQFGLYQGGGTGGALLGGSAPITYGVGHGWNSAAVSMIHVAPNTPVAAAVYAPADIQTLCYDDGGGFYFNTSGGWTNPYSGTFKSWGNLPWHISYFPRCQVTSIPSNPVFPGATIDVYGLSFSAGVISVTINGLACSSVNVIDDGHLTCVLPTNATTGQITVNTNAGSGTSASNLTVSGGRVEQGGTLHYTTAVRVAQGGVLHPVTRIRVYNGGVLKDAH